MISKFSQSLGWLTKYENLHEKRWQSYKKWAGDADAVAKTVAKELNLDRYYARVLPQDKASLIHRLKAEQPTAFVGDGINDAPALTEADLGMAIGAGTNVAIESADLVLVNSDPLDATYALKLAKATYSKMTQNLFWATGYNVIGIPLAAGIAAPFGILLSPAVGAILMSVSTVVVSINAMLLRREHGLRSPQERRRFGDRDR
jgi:Cu2+-exporting ATPase